MLCHMKAIGYVRVSTDRQVEHGVSLEAQGAQDGLVQTSGLLKTIAVLLPCSAGSTQGP